jgi:translation initiation factor IF-2
VPRNVATLAKSKGVKIHSHSVIYTLIDQVKDSMAALLEPEVITHVDGEAMVQEIFTVTVKKKKEIIAGCKILTGKVARNLPIRLIRNGKDCLTGNIKTLKHHKKDILEAQKGLECGIAIEGVDDIVVGDIIQSLSTTTKKQAIE